MTEAAENAKNVEVLLAVENLSIGLREGKDVFLTHGHRSALPPVGAAQLMFSGHTHVPTYHDYGDLVHANPGSVSLPRSGSNHSCIIYEPGLLRWLTLGGEEYRREVLPTP